MGETPSAPWVYIPGPFQPDTQHAMDLQKHWKDHTKVTDLMVAQLKENLKLWSDWGLRVITNDEHRHGFKEDIPEGYVAWLIVPPACKHLTGFFLNDDNVRYTSPSGDCPLHRKEYLLLKSKEEEARKEAIFKKWNQQPHVAAMKIDDPERYERCRRALEAIHNFMKTLD